jgi:hypothetical protein
MKRLFATLMSVAVMATFTPVGEAQTSCPAEVSKAKELLAMKGSVAKGQDVQAPRSLAGARGQDTQAPRGQDTQAPRGQDTQAPRGQDTQAPRATAAAKPAGSSKATALIKEAEAACKAGDMTTAKAKAEAAIAELK